MRKLALIDLGTNTFHLLIVEVDEQGNQQILVREKIPVKLGEGGISTGNINDAAWQRGMNTLSDFKQKMEHYRVEDARAMATSAMRNAANGAAFVQEVQERLGIIIEVIDGAREAELIYKGVRSALQITERSVIMDIGGGSVEFIICDGEQIFWKQSFELGAQRLMDKFFHHDPILPEEVATEKAYLSEQLQPLTQAIQQYQPKVLIGSSGTFDTLCDIDWWKRGLDRMQENTSPEDKISIEHFYTIFHEILSKTHDERLAIKGMLEMRVDMIVVAVVVVDFVLQQYQLEQIRVSAYALKEGMLAELLNS